MGRTRIDCFDDEIDEMSIIVTLPYDPTWKALEWIKKQDMNGYITNTATCPSSPRGDYSINYYFSDEKSAAWFALKWL